MKSTYNDHSLEAQLFTWDDLVEERGEWGGGFVKQQLYNAMLLQELPGLPVGTKFAFVIIDKSMSTIACYDYNSKKVFEGKLKLSIVSV